MKPTEKREQEQRKAQVERQLLGDPRYITAPAGKAPLVKMSPLVPFAKSRVRELARAHAINIYSRPSHRTDF